MSDIFDDLRRAAAKIAEETGADKVWREATQQGGRVWQDIKDNSKSRAQCQQDGHQLQLHVKDGEPQTVTCKICPRTWRVTRDHL